MAGDLVLLTGATGMIGFRILTIILEQGFHVRAAVRNQAGFDKIAARPSISPYQKANKLNSIIVPDITATGAYDEAVKGVKFVVHVASPLAGNTPGVDFKSELITPAIRGTVGMLESAAKTTGIQRVVITASVASLRELPETETYTSHFEAYTASKVLSYQATKTFMSTQKPSFDVINIMPSFVLGRDATVSEPTGITKGTNALFMGPLLGHPLFAPQTGGATVHIDDVAKLHVLALDTDKVKGNQDFIADSGNKEAGMEWADSFEIVERRFPEAWKKGVFKVDGPKMGTAHGPGFDTGSTKSVFGIEFKGFEEQVCDVVGFYLELLESK